MCVKPAHPPFLKGGRGDFAVLVQDLQNPIHTLKNIQIGKPNHL